MSSASLQNWYAKSFCGIGIWTQVLVLAKQALYHLHHIPSLWTVVLIAPLLPATYRETAMWKGSHGYTKLYDSICFLIQLERFWFRQHVLGVFISIFPLSIAQILGAVYKTNIRPGRNWEDCGSRPTWTKSSHNPSQPTDGHGSARLSSQPREEAQIKEAQSWLALP
jgi:hypothetical protein